MRRATLLLTGLALPIFLALDAPGAAPPGDRPVAYRGARILTAAGAPIADGVLVVQRGTIKAMRITPGRVLGGLKMANGENPKGWNFGARKMAPATRMKVAALQREQLVKAREYRRQWAAYRKAKKAGKDATPPDTDLGLEPLVEVLERKRTVHFHSHRADDL